LKPKTAFESGNSPPKISESGALIQTGRGLEETKRRITEAFEDARKNHATREEHNPAQHEELPTPPPEIEYGEHHRARFHERARRLSLAAPTSSHISTGARRDVVCWEIEMPTQTASELIEEALKKS
jgi:hypothetical protein